MRALRWMIPAAGIVLLSLVGCNEDATEEASDTTVIEDQEPDVIIEQDDEGFEADVDVDEDGKVEAEVKVED
ncbi:MAG TPA: hypothetical protein VFH69_06175 [Gemmatimonadota bacterium]|nr:hypothetical protein [Gemmatimonadota bacterium]